MKDYPCVSMQTIIALRNEIAAENRDTAGKASANLAELIWDGQVSNDALQLLLNDENDNVRAEVAWAIRDFRGPPQGVKWLFTYGLKDSYNRVRYHSLNALREMRYFSHECCDIVRAIADEGPSPEQRIASELLTSWQDAGLI